MIFTLLLLGIHWILCNTTIAEGFKNDLPITMYYKFIHCFTKTQKSKSKSKTKTLKSNPNENPKIKRNYENLEKKGGRRKKEGIKKEKEGKLKKVGGLIQENHIGIYNIYIHNISININHYTINTMYNYTYNY